MLHSCPICSLFSPAHVFGYLYMCPWYFVAISVAQHELSPSIVCCQVLVPFLAILYPVQSLSPCWCPALVIFYHGLLLSLRCLLTILILAVAIQVVV